MLLANHGGGCCGVRHVHSLDNSTVAELDNLIATLDATHNVSGPDAGRLIEVILSSRQVGEEGRQYGARWATCVAAAGGWPAVLAARGFRLVSRFENANSGNDCYIFHRVPHFKSVRQADLPFTWNHRDTGPRPLEAGGPGRAAAVTAYAVGDRIRYRNINNTLGGQRGTITNVRRNGNYNIRFDNGERRENYTSTYFERIDTPAPVHVVHTYFVNVYRTSGRSATMHATRQAAMDARGNPIRIDRADVMSDGTTTWTENV